MIFNDRFRPILRYIYLFIYMVTESFPEIQMFKTNSIPTNASIWLISFHLMELTLTTENSASFGIQCPKTRLITIANIRRQNPYKRRRAAISVLRYSRFPHFIYWSFNRTNGFHNILLENLFLKYPVAPVLKKQTI